MKEVHPLELCLAAGKQVAVNNLGRNRNINKSTIENYINIPVHSLSGTVRNKDER